MNDSIEFFVQDGKFGRHAGGRYPAMIWASHPTDDRSAVWKAAHNYWFGRRDNNLMLYTEIRAIEVTEIAPNTFRADLTVSDADVRSLTWARDFTPRLEMLLPKAKPTAKKDVPPKRKLRAKKSAAKKTTAKKTAAKKGGK